MRKTVLLVFGTRPDAIKMCPLVQELRRHPDRARTVVCVTGQHRELLYQALNAFGVAPDYDLAVMRDGQVPGDVIVEILSRLPSVLDEVRPDIVLVHGDSTSAFAAALCCFYRQIPVGHVEAGLRTHNMAAPFPEEFHRTAVGLVAAYHFAPTEASRQNLLREGKPDSTVFVTGNTVIDALQTTVRDDWNYPGLAWAAELRLLLVTAHRRENLGVPMRRIFRAIRRILDDFPDTRAVLPVHPNPAVRRLAEEELSGCGHIRLIPPMDVVDFHNLLARAYLVLTDSGGVQEEATALGRPTLVVRDTTERPEGVEAGTLRLTGTREEDIYAACAELLTSHEAYERMAHAANLYGDGTASRQIAEVLLRD